MCRSDPQQICALKIDAMRAVDGGRLADGVAGMYVWLDFGPLSRRLDRFPMEPMMRVYAARKTLQQAAAIAR